MLPNDPFQKAINIGNRFALSRMLNRIEAESPLRPHFRPFMPRSACASAGSDHAWAGQHFVIGGKVKGGQMLNKFPSSLKDSGRFWIQLFRALVSRRRVGAGRPWRNLWKGYQLENMIIFLTLLREMWNNYPWQCACQTGLGGSKVDDIENTHQTTKSHRRTQ